ncbi:hypothetical protein PUN28_019699 [Cardiocondyla obscurior]|uniref:Uncharacterized protein n=1 Tax=Cardiocondyla obscurior TaxID=286306 RepID=A0AAW2EFJ0_9HYME
MPKHKSAKRSSSSRHSKKVRSRKNSSGSRSSSVDRRDHRSRDSRSSDSRRFRHSSSRRSGSGGRYEGLLREFCNFLASRESCDRHNLNSRQVRMQPNYASSQRSRSVSPLDAAGASPPEQILREHTVALNDRGSVPGMSSCRPSSLNFLAKRGHNRCVPSSDSSFSLDTPAVENLILNVPGGELQSVDDTPGLSFVDEFFGGTQAAPVSSSWILTILGTIQSYSRNGLSEDMKKDLLSKYELKGELSVLAPQVK